MAGEERRGVDPDALLASLKEEERGTLTVFLGAAAGVGKTYAMLLAARERLAEGTDVVVGWVESHGRPETESLIQGLPAIPPRRVEYKGHTFQELDLDALLKRHPELAIVDELAHTNVPGSRNARRYQDVEELLAAGIDVYTTLNIQHVESLNDVVARITGVLVRETVPDAILEHAELKLVDIPAEDLLQRLREGKVYVPHQAQEALRKFFRPGNIGALRELAMRYAARRVDRDVHTYMRAHAIPGPWPTAERVLVCVGPSPFSAQLIRAAYRMATGFRTEWLAVFVDTPAGLPGGVAAREQLAKNLHLAEELGAEIVTVSGDDVADEILRLARQRNVSHLIIGKPLYQGWRRWLHGEVVDRLIRQSEGISVHVIPGKPHRVETSPAPLRRPAALPVSQLAGASAMVLGVTILGKLAEPYLGPVNLALAYLIPIMTSAMLWGTAPAVVAAVLGILTFDFLFVPPVFFFTVADSRYFFAFAIFLAVAWWSGALVGRLQQHVRRARERENRLSALYALSREMTASTDLEALLNTTVRKTAESVEGEVVLLLPAEQGELEVRASFIDGEAGADARLLTPNERAVAVWVYENGRPAGRGTDTLNGASGLYLPLKTENTVVGVLGVWLHTKELRLLPDRRRLLEAFSSLVAVAVNRVRLAEQARQTYRLEESERLWMALFNSLSHDLRTPLASITGSVTGLLEGGDLYDQAARRELLQTIKTEAARLNRLVGNLFDMARVRSGMLQLNKEWCDLEDIVGVAVNRLQEQASRWKVKTEIEPGLPLVQADLVLIEQVLVNLLDNAFKYSEPGSEVRIAARRRENEVVVSVSDQGIGLAPAEIEHLFDQFYRGGQARQVSGTGLGLTICKAVVEAHGGRMWAENNGDRGATFFFTLPLSGEGPGQIPAAGAEGA
ncbi:MAG TPA: sensor histidine kinase KdpD [Firmicutes bacterium]|nr:sensor histidine kinase KdpD [Bacillota bacterium]